jgi:poly(3-hydroxybutyrate) depolymerase
MRMRRVLQLLVVAGGLFGLACSESDTSAPSNNPGSGGHVSSAGGGNGTSGGEMACAGSTANATGGAAGTSSTGAGGSATGGNTGTGGEGGMSSVPDAGPVAAMPSAGCNKVATETPGQYVKHSLMSSGTSRDFYTYLPTGYDPKKPYKTIFAFHPCGGSGNPSSNVPIQTESKQDAIIIAPQSQGACYENQIRNSPDVVLFDDTLTYAEANYCVDQSRVFAMGYSAGSWMAIILGCERSNVIRAHAQVSGGLPIFIRPGVDCKGSVAALFIHDTGDPQNTINGGYAARDRVVRMDGCSGATMPWAPAPCQAYQECKPGYPVVWCETTGKGHDRQDALAPAAIWKFFSQF